MAAFELNIEQYPFCFLRFDGDMTVGELDDYIASFNKLYEREQPFAIITHLKSYRSNSEIIARFGRWFKDTEPLIKRWWVCNAMYCASPGFRFLLGAVFLIKPLPIPYKVCSSPEDALVWARGEWTRSGKVAPMKLKWPF